MKQIYLEESRKAGEVIPAGAATVTKRRKRRGYSTARKKDPIVSQTRHGL